MQVINTSDLKAGDRVLVRASLNVSLGDKDEIIDDLRLHRVIDTIQIIQTAGGIPILLSHIKNSQGSTLKPVVSWFARKGFTAQLITNYFPHNTDINFEPGTLYVFENLRDFPGEKENNLEFALALSEYGDSYVNESFDSAHRAHASTVQLPKLLPSFAGVNFAREVEELSKVFTPDRPFTFIIGGAKLETKLPLIKKLLEMADKVFVGGALMNPLLQARGINVGKSLLPDSSLDVSSIIENENLVLPIDFIDQNNQVISAEETDDTTVLLGIGPETRQSLQLIIEESKLCIWNGPLGNYEAGYVKGTDLVAKTLSESGCYSIIGGGDTLSATSDEVESNIDWVSTGGGAMLDFIESNGQLRAIEVLG